MQTLYLVSTQDSTQDLTSSVGLDTQPGSTPGCYSTNVGGMILD